MTDLEITKRCAQAMGYEILTNFEHLDANLNQIPPLTVRELFPDGYNPLKDDAQCFALLKKVRVECWSIPLETGEIWSVVKGMHGKFYQGADLNRAICECVSKLTAPA